MSIIKNALSLLMGKEGGSWKWIDHIRPASFRGVPFGVVSGESVFGRRQAIHQFPYRDQSWVEDLGRSNRRLTIKGFLIQDSLVYDAPDVITQRNNLIVACEEGKTGTLIHPTLGELTVSVTESGLRMTESAENGRIFEFDLTVVESGIKVFALTESEKTGQLTRRNWLKEASTTTAKYISLVKKEIRSLTQTLNTIKQTSAFWTNMSQSTLNGVTNFSNTLDSTFGSQKYGRYQQGNSGGSVSGATGKRTRQREPENDRRAIDKALSAAVIEREKLNEALAAVNTADSIETWADNIQNTFALIINLTLGINQKLHVLLALSQFKNSAYQPTSEARHITALTNLLLVSLAASALAAVSGECEPQNSADAAKKQRQVCAALSHAMTVAGDLAIDDIYQALLAWREQVTLYFRDKGAEKGRLAAYSLPAVLPTLTVAYRFYQDANRADELMMELNPRHPAFIPVKFKALKK